MKNNMFYFLNKYKHFLLILSFLIINVKNSCAAYYFVKTVIFFKFFVDWSLKEQHLFDIETFYNIINVFTVTLINLLCHCWIKVLIT